MTLFHKVECKVNAFVSHDDVIKRKHSVLMAICARNPPVIGEYPSQRPLTRRFAVFFICAWINGWVNNGEAGDLRRHYIHYDVTVMYVIWSQEITICLLLIITYIPEKMHRVLLLLMLLGLFCHLLLDLYYQFSNILQGYYIDTGEIMPLFQYQWSNPERYE